MLKNGGEARIRNRDTVPGIPVLESKLVGYMSDYNGSSKAVVVHKPHHLLIV